VPGVLPSVIPYRVAPGRLAVSRAIGDAEAKLNKFNGKAKVVIAKPDIYTLRVEDDLDFVVLCSDGVFDKMSNQEVTNVVWKSIKTDESLHLDCEKAVKNIIKISLDKRSTDNITAVVIAFNNKIPKDMEIKERTSRNMNLTLKSHKKLVNVKNKNPSSRVLTNQGARKVPLKFVKKKNVVLPEIASSLIKGITSPYFKPY